MKTQNEGADLPTAIEEVMLMIGEQSFGWKERHVAGHQVRALVNAPEDEELFVVIKEKEEHVLLGHDERIDILETQIDFFYFKKFEIKDVTIKINDIDRKIMPGWRTVAEIKNIGEVPLAYELEQVIDGKLIPLDDNGRVEIAGCEEFYGHVKDGSSS